LPKSIDRIAEWKLRADESLDPTYIARGIGGQLTGWGLTDVVFDDLFKNGKQAKSATTRESIIDGVVSAAMSRLKVATLTRNQQVVPNVTFPNWIHPR
jgi:hypothetical protein